MALFSRILQVDPHQLEQTEKRLAKRFVIPKESPLRAEILVGPAALPVRLLDLSTTGTRVAFPGDRAVAPQASCTVRLIIEELVVKLEGKIMNVNLTGGETQLGLHFGENKFAAREDLIQLLEPIEIGASLSEVDPSVVKQTEPGLVTRRYFSARATSLTLWRRLEDEALQGFEMHLRQYYVRSGPNPPQLKVFLDDGTQAFGYSAPTLQQSSEINAEVRRCFNWIVPHLTPNLPQDIRDFLARYVT